MQIMIGQVWVGASKNLIYYKLPGGSWCLWSTNLIMIARDIMTMPSTVMFKSKSMGVSNCLIFLTKVKRLMMLFLHYMNLNTSQLLSEESRVLY